MENINQDNKQSIMPETIKRELLSSSLSLRREKYSHNNESVVLRREESSSNNYEKCIITMKKAELKRSNAEAKGKFESKKRQNKIIQNGWH